jgi:hypothetical protein
MTSIVYNISGASLDLGPSLRGVELWTRAWYAPAHQSCLRRAPGSCAVFLVDGKRWTMTLYDGKGGGLGRVVRNLCFG